MINVRKYGFSNTQVVIFWFFVGLISSLILTGCGAAGAEGAMAGERRPVRPAGAVTGGAVHSNTVRHAANQAGSYGPRTVVYPLSTMDGYIPPRADMTFEGGEMVLGRIKNLVDDTLVGRVRSFIGTPYSAAKAIADVAIYEISNDKQGTASLVDGSHVHHAFTSGAPEYIDSVIDPPILLRRDKQYAVGIMVNNDGDGFPIMQNAIQSLMPAGMNHGIRGVDDNDPPALARFAASGFEEATIGVIDEGYLVLSLLYPDIDVASFP